MNGTSAGMRTIWKLLLLGALAAGAGACSLNPGQGGAVVRIEVPRAQPDARPNAMTARAPAYAAATDPTSPSPTGTATPPATLDQVACWAVNVSGPGIPVDPTIPGGSCGLSDALPPGVVAGLVPVEGGAVELLVPQGKDRTFQLIAFTSTTGECPTIDEIKANDGPDKFGLEGPWEVARVTVDVAGDTVVPIDLSGYAQESAKRVFCDGKEGDGSGADPTTLTRIMPTGGNTAPPGTDIMLDIWMLENGQPVVGATPSLAFAGGTADVMNPGSLITDDAGHAVAQIHSSGASHPTVTLTNPPPGPYGPIATELHFDRPMALFGGLNHSCARFWSGRIYCWGSNVRGQFGDGSTGGSNHGIRVTALEPLTVIESSLADGFTGLSGDIPYAWGDGLNGVLGQGSPLALSSVPIQISGGDTGIMQIHRGEEHGCYVYGSGQIKCWGANDVGQLGGGSVNGAPQYAPVAITSSAGWTTLTSGVSKVSAGQKFTCAIGNDFLVWCWGQNSLGQLGDGTDTDAISAPVNPSLGGATVSDVRAGAQHVCARTGSGGLYCWGANGSGQADPVTPSTARATPVLVPLPASVPVSDFSPGLAHTCAAANDYHLYCWGSNASGQLGAGDTSATSGVYDVSANVSTSASGDRVVSGAHHTCALIDGWVKCWGSNALGQLGTGSTLDSYSPAMVQIQW